MNQLDEHEWFGEARALLQKPASPSTWWHLGELILAARGERWFVTHALPYLENSLSRWPNEVRAMPASWSNELTGKLHTALEIQRSEGIPWTNIMRGRWDHFSLARHLVLPREAWADPFELMELLRRCTSLAHIEIVGGSLAMREVASLRQVPSLRSIDMTRTSWSFDDLRGGASLFEIWPELERFATRSIGRRARAVERMQNTIEHERTLRALSIWPEDNSGTESLLGVIATNTPHTLDLGEFHTWMLPSRPLEFTHRELIGRGVASLERLAGAGLLAHGMESLVIETSARVSDGEPVSLAPLSSSAAARSLRHLEILDGGVLLADVSALAALEGLESLEIGRLTAASTEGDIDLPRDEGQRGVSALLSGTDPGRWRRLGMSSLLTLEIPSCRAPIFEALAQMSAIEHLDLSDCCTETGILAELASNATWQSLKSLDWSHNALGAKDLEALLEGVEGSGLVSLDLRGCQLDDDLLERLLEGLPRGVRDLNVGGSPSLGAKSYERLFAWARERHASHVGFDRCRAASVALGKLSSPLEHVSAVSVSEQKPGSWSEWLFKHLERFPALRDVYLPGEASAVAWWQEAMATDRWVECRAGIGARKLHVRQRDRARF